MERTESSDPAASVPREATLSEISDLESLAQLSLKREKIIFDENEEEEDTASVCTISQLVQEDRIQQVEEAERRRTLQQVEEAERLWRLRQEFPSLNTGVCPLLI